MQLFKRKNTEINTEDVIRRMEELKRQKDEQRERRFDDAFHFLMDKVRRGEFEVSGDFIGIDIHNLAITEQALEQRLEGTAFYLSKIDRQYQQYTVWLFLRDNDNPLWDNS
jgi:hypothetical protein